jgi:elongation factor G
MKEYATHSIRNVALVSHAGAGKTSLGEAMLFVSGAVTRMGKVEDGTTVSDFEDEEIRRTLSLSTAVLPVETHDCKVNVLDTPGYTDFVGEVISALRVADTALVLVDAVAGVEVGTEIVWDYCDRFELPRFVVINKMDRENAGFKRAMDSVRALSPDSSFVPVQIPWGEKLEFKGVIDLMDMQAKAGNGEKGEAIPDELAEAAEEARLTLVEAAAEGDDALLEKYLDGGSLSSQEISRGFKKAVLEGRFVPVFLTAASAGTGIVPLLDALVELVPSPGEVGAVTMKGAKGDESLHAGLLGHIGSGLASLEC